MSQIMRTLAFSIVIVLFCSWSCLLSPLRAQQESTSSNPDADEYTIYSLVVETQFNLKKVRKIVIEQDRAVPGILADPIIDRRQRFQAEIRKLIPEVRADTIADFEAESERSRQFKHPLDLKVPCVFITRKDIAGFFSAPRYGWANFYKAYPGSQGILTLSHVGFNSNKNEALVYFENQSDYEGGAAYFALLRKRNGSWMTVTQKMVWMS